MRHVRKITKNLAHYRLLLRVARHGSVKKSTYCSRWDLIGR